MVSMIKRNECHEGRSNPIEFLTCFGYCSFANEKETKNNKTRRKKKKKHNRRNEYLSLTDKQTKTTARIDKNKFLLIDGHIPANDLVEQNKRKERERITIPKITVESKTEEEEEENAESDEQ